MDRTEQEETKARNKFTSLLNDDKDFFNTWGISNNNNNNTTDDYSELDFQEWFTEYWCNKQ